ncbi:MAG: right-handed parallel beta-helix repeat-containing protein [Chitinophagaceae bacterium]|nr:right-handed parallel beta-helix repeat-containing protein [Chitinophagaceae bacterium]
MNSPVRTLERARQIIYSRKTADTVSVLIAPGTYNLKETLVFTPHHNKLSITFKAILPHTVVFSGGALLKPAWRPWRDGILTTQVADVENIDQLYINGAQQRMARFPNVQMGKNVFDAWDLSHNPAYNEALDGLSKTRIARWRNPEGAYIHAMHEALWGDMHWQAQGKETDTTLLYEGGWQNNRPSPMHKVYRMVENVLEELDDCGEWYYDKKMRRLYYKPFPQQDMGTALVEVVKLQELVKYSGSEKLPVRNIHFEGIIFRHAARTFMENKEPLLRSDWTLCRKGAMVFEGAEDCSISNCEFDQVGGNAIVVTHYNRRIKISNVYIHHSGASGIVFAGNPAAVRSPIFRYGPQNFSTMDRTPGPLLNDYPAHCIVEDCLMAYTGRHEKQTAGIHISMAHNILVRHSTVHNVPRAGININEGTFGGHIIEHCDVFNTVLETGDHGSFNSWGRDRFWTPDIKETAKEVAAFSKLPYIDMLGPNVIRNSRWRCDHGWDIDLDDGSSWYEIYNNLLLNGGLKLREGYNRKVYNNVIVNNSLHPHVWYPQSGDVFTRNIVFSPYKPILMPNAEKWGTKIDSNFFVGSSAAALGYLGNGCDSNSVWGNPFFMAPDAGDFRIQQGSPVQQMGFVNFSMDSFGVRPQWLKALAKSPSIPTIQTSIIKGSSTALHDTLHWGGMILATASGEALSAFGAGFAEGGVYIVHINEDAPFLKFGFRSGDLIQHINDTKIKQIIDFKRVVNQRQGHSMHIFSVMRLQSVIPIKVSVMLSPIH